MSNDELKVTLTMLDITYYPVREKDNGICLFLPDTNNNNAIFLKNLLKNNNFKYSEIFLQTGIYNLYIYLKGEINNENG